MSGFPPGIYGKLLNILDINRVLLGTSKPYHAGECSIAVAACYSGLGSPETYRNFMCFSPPNIRYHHVGMGQNPVPLVNLKIAGKWMFIPLKMYLSVLTHTHVSLLHVINKSQLKIFENHLPSTFNSGLFALHLFRYIWYLNWLTPGTNTAMQL